MYVQYDIEFKKSANATLNRVIDEPVLLRANFLAPQGPLTSVF